MSQCFGKTSGTGIGDNSQYIGEIGTDVVAFQYLICLLRITYDDTQNTIFRSICNGRCNDPYIFFSKQSQDFTKLPILILQENRNLIYCHSCIFLFIE